MPGTQDHFTRWLAGHAAAPGVAWLEQKLASLTPENFAVVFAGVARRIGHATVELSRLELRALVHGEALLQVGAAVPSVGSPQFWAETQLMPLSGLVRAVLVSRALSLAESAQALEFLKRTFDTGDNLERTAVLRSLWLLPEPERFVPLAIDACRTHVQDVFEAIACENPYPAQYFPEAALNQLVLKCFFTEVPLRRVVALAQRTNPELARMALAYASERTAAGRSVPDDLALVSHSPDVL